MKTWFIRRLDPGDIPPRGFGLAWRDYMRDQGVVMPVPLNIIVAFFRSLYWFLLVGWYDHITRDRDERALVDAILFQEACEDAYRDGYMAGLRSKTPPYWMAGR